jgi:predicted GNAT family acetyltransferase
MPFLLRNEAENCFFIGYIPHQATPDDILLAVEDDAGAIVAVCLKTPHRLVARTDAMPGAIDAMVDYFIDAGVDLPGVQARPELARRFADRFTRVTGRGVVDTVAMAIHQLDRVTTGVADGIPGALRLARPDEVELLARYIGAMVVECKMPPVDDELSRARDRIARGVAYFWCVDGVPVSTTSAVGPTPNGIRISLVYTPPEHRRRGYATVAVATLSQQLLDAGR